jgi:hypothetical protein
LSFGKEPWRFRDLDDQLNVYLQQWQADQQKQIIAQMAGKHPNKSNDRKRISSDKNHHNFMAVALVIAMETLLAEGVEGAEDVEEAVEVAAGEETIVSIYRV